MGLLLACGCFFDYLVACGISLHFVKDLDALSQVLLQIQGTVVSLTISVMALLSGNIKDSTLGVSLTDYYLNRRPWIFKQYRIMIYSLLLLIANVLIHTWSWYNLVLCLFVASFVPVVISILEIYAVFRGKYSIDREIEQYVRSVFSENGNREEQYSLLESLTDDLAKEGRENTIEYEQYCQMYLYACGQLLGSGDNDISDSVKEGNHSEKNPVSMIQKTGHRWIHCLFSSREPIQIQWGFELLYELYDMMWKVSDGTEEAEEKADFHLFEDIHGEIFYSLKQLSAEEARECLRLPLLMRRIAVMVVRSQKIGEYQNREREHLNTFMKMIGYYLAGCKKRNDVYRETDWGEILRHFPIYLMYRDCCDGAEDYNSIHAAMWVPTSLLFNYYFGLLMYRFCGIIGVSFYRECISSLGIDMQRSESGDAIFKGEAFLAVSIHIYLYYVAKGAYEKSVAEAIRSGAVRLFESREVRENFTKFLGTLYWRNKILSKEFEKELEIFLGQYELYSENVNESILLCRKTARDCFLFIMAYLSWQHDDTQLLERVLDVDLYQVYISDEEEGYTKHLFSQMAVSVGYEWEEEERKCADGHYEEQKAEKIYRHLKKWLMKSLKLQEQKRAREDLEAYQSKGIERLCEEISKLTEQRLCDEFSVILRKKENKNQQTEELCKEEEMEDGGELQEMPVKMRLLKYENYTRYIHEQGFIKDCVSYVTGGFIRELYQALMDEECIFLYNRKRGLDSDEDYLDLLEREEIKIMLGDEYRLKNHDFRENHRFREIMRRCTCVYAADALVGLALKGDALEVEINKVRTKIRPLSWEEIEEQVSYNEETGRYEYKLYGQETIEFKKDELTEYMQSMRQVVEIYADVLIRKKKEYVGLAVRMER